MHALNKCFIVFVSFYLECIYSVTTSMFLLTIVCLPHRTTKRWIQTPSNLRLQWIPNRQNQNLHYFPFVSWNAKTNLILSWNKGNTHGFKEIGNRDVYKPQSQRKRQTAEKENQIEQAMIGTFEALSKRLKTDEESEAWCKRMV